MITPFARVAVYGTLRKGQHNHAILEDSGGKFLGSFWTTRDWTMYDLGGYPAVTKDGSDSIFLEVYEVEVMGMIDQLEGYPDYYNRTYINTPYGGAWIYFLNDEQLPNIVTLVSSGDYVQHKQV